MKQESIDALVLDEKHKRQEIVLDAAKIRLGNDINYEDIEGLLHTEADERSGCITVFLNRLPLVTFLPMQNHINGRSGTGLSFQLHNEYNT
jgi:hypothetical protein